MEFESRESFRVGSENFISYRLFDADNQVFGEGVATTVDISRTGIAIKSSTEMEAGHKIELTIGVADDIVKTVGRVRNQLEMEKNNYQIGIEFDFLSDQDLDKLATMHPDINK